MRRARVIPVRPCVPGRRPSTPEPSTATSRSFGVDLKPRDDRRALPYRRARLSVSSRGCNGVIRALLARPDAAKGP